MRLLIVDDNAADSLVLATMLKAMDHEVSMADCGTRALQVLQEREVDLVILDEEMPDYRGHEVVQLIRQQTDEWLPVVFLSGNHSPEAVLRSISFGGDDYLKKPVNAIELEAKMLAMRRFNEMRRELQLLNKELVRKNHLLNDMAMHDPLTGLFNRRALDEKFAEALLWCRRQHTPVSLLLMDIDWFKAFNDHYGHQPGDQCLLEVGQRIEQAVKRGTDTVYRYGGEEFCVLLPATATEQATVVAQSIQAALKTPRIPHLGSQFGQVTLSIGIAGASADSIDLDHLLSTADEALYNAKRLGRNRYEISRQSR